jgi:hypothetical protein
VPVTADQFEAISPGLPSHQDEVLAGHEGRPTVAEQAVSHGAGIPAADNGMTDQQKYGA